MHRRPPHHQSTRDQVDVVPLEPEQLSLTECCSKREQDRRILAPFRVSTKPGDLQNYDLGGIYACCDTALTGTRIDHNWIHDPANTGNGLHFDNGTYDVSADHNVIWNLKGTGDVNHGGNGINFGGHTNAPPAGSKLPYLKGTFYNNTILAGVNYTIFNYFASSSYDANLTVRNNILDGAQPAGQSFGYIAGGAPVQDHNLLTTFSANGDAPNPLYASVTNGNLSLMPGSPAIDAGATIMGITDGYQGPAADEGAYESGAATWKPGATM